MTQFTPDHQDLINFAELGIRNVHWRWDGPWRLSQHPQTKVWWWTRSVQKIGDTIDISVAVMDS